MKTLLFSLYLLIACHVQAQRSYTDEISASFKTGSYTLVRSEFYGDRGNDVRKARRYGLIMEGFEATSFMEYANLFLPGECHVTEAGWQNWKLNLGKHRPVILANFILQNKGNTYCVTKYALRYGGREYLVAQAHKQLNGKWYYLNFQENIERQDMIMFFAVCREEFLSHSNQHLASRSKNDLLCDGHGSLKGTQLIEAYNAKYRSDNPLYATLNLLFEDRIRSLEEQRTDAQAVLVEYFRSASLPSSEQDYLRNLIAASQDGEAILHFSKLTGKTVSQIFRECPNAIRQ